MVTNTDGTIDSPGGGGSSESAGGLGSREFKALEGLTPVEARLLMTSLVDDATASGIGEMLRKEEASKQVKSREEFMGPSDRAAFGCR